MCFAYICIYVGNRCNDMFIIVMNKNKWKCSCLKFNLNYLINLHHNFGRQFKILKDSYHLRVYMYVSYIVTTYTFKIICMLFKTNCLLTPDLLPRHKFYLGRFSKVLENYNFSDQFIAIHFVHSDPRNTILNNYYCHFFELTVIPYAMGSQIIDTV